jgi:tRNA-Thr(GGU) m(6)t(6)A37 methyltransferase TsaA
MVRLNEIREGELAVELPSRPDPGSSSAASARPDVAAGMPAAARGWADLPIEVLPPWHLGIAGIEAYERLEILYWLHESRRDLIHQSPRNDGAARGVFSLRTPVRPNPIGTSIAHLVRVEGPVLFVRGLDCLDDTPLIDLKPDRTLFEPLAPPQVGDFQVGDR